MTRGGLREAPRRTGAKRAASAWDPARRMAFMGRILTNDFSWSKSRHEKFSECLRAYYFHYYRSWGGWELARAAGRARALRAQEAQQPLHLGGQRGARRHQAGARRDRAGRAPVDPQQAIERAHRLMQEDFRHSASRGYWHAEAPQGVLRAGGARVRRARLRRGVEAELGDGEGRAEWFFASRWPALARSLPKRAVAGGRRGLRVLHLRRSTA